MTNLKLIKMTNIETQEVYWLWHPYIPFGKITIVQGDPGEGKTHFILAVVSALTNGEQLFHKDSGRRYAHVILSCHNFLLDGGLV